MVVLLGATRLLLAAQKGRVDDVRSLLEGGASIDCRDKNGNTALYLAVENNCLDVARLLIEKHRSLVYCNNMSGASPLHIASWMGHVDMVSLIVPLIGDNINSLDGQGQTPLYVASEKGHIIIVQLLVEHGAVLERASTTGWMPIHAACFYGHLDVAHFLLSQAQSMLELRTTNDDSTPLFFACAGGRYEVARLLLEAGINFESKNQIGMTALHAASHQNQSEVVRLLLEYGADIDVTDNNGWTPLHWAMEKHGDHHLETIRYLLGYDATQSADLSGCTPLHAACVFQCWEPVRLLLDYGAMIESVNQEGQTPLQVAAFHGSLDNVRLLVEAGANMEVVDSKGETLLIWASENNHVDLAKSLLAKGARVNSSNGLSVLQRATFKGHMTMMQELLAVGADPECIDEKGDTLLLGASRSGKLEVVRCLLDGGAQSETTDSNGSTALQLSCYNGHLDIIRLLLTKNADVGRLDENGDSLLGWASEQGKGDVVRLLLEGGAKIESKTNELTALQRASFKLHYEVARLLLSKGANTEWTDADGMTLLLWAIKTGEMTFFRMLLDSGARVTCTTKEKQSPLSLACYEGNFDMVRLLIAKGAVTVSKDNKDWTSLHWAVQKMSRRQSDIVRCLLEYGAELESQTQEGYTPLLLACSNGFSKVVRFLLDRHANMRSTDVHGDTALHLATLSGDTETVRLLLARGASLDARNNNGFTALDIAREKGLNAVVKLLTSSVEAIRLAEEKAVAKAEADARVKARDEAKAEAASKAKAKEGTIAHKTRGGGGASKAPEDEPGEVTNSCQRCCCFTICCACAVATALLGVPLPLQRLVPAKKYKNGPVASQRMDRGSGKPQPGGADAIAAAQAQQLAALQLLCARIEQESALSRQTLAGLVSSSAGGANDVLELAQNIEQLANGADETEYTQTETGAECEEYEAERRAEDAGQPRTVYRYSNEPEAEFAEEPAAEYAAEYTEEYTAEYTEEYYEPEYEEYELEEAELEYEGE